MVKIVVDNNNKNNNYDKRHKNIPNSFEVSGIDIELQSKVLKESVAARKLYIGIKPEMLKESRMVGKRKHNFGGKVASLVTDNILLGSKDDANNVEFLNKVGCTHILNLTTNIPIENSDLFITKRIGFEDSTDATLYDVSKPALMFLEEVENIDGRVLIHCKSGVSRAPAIVLLHLIVKHEIRLNMAYKHIKAMRPYIAPNDTFKFQLAEVEVRNLGESSVHNMQEWDFYEYRVLKQKISNTTETDLSDYCCVIT